MTSLSLSIDADIPDTVDLFGKKASDLQENIGVYSMSQVIDGTLKYVDDYSAAFGGDLSSGNYLALHMETPGIGAPLTEEGLAALLLRGYGRYDPLYVLNQTDDEALSVRAERIAAKLEQDGHSSAILSLQRLGAALFLQ